jgi:hypothetical protein
VCGSTRTYANLLPFHSLYPMSIMRLFRRPEPGDEHKPGSGAFRFKAFLSYSHAADGRLAPALQSALHRIARPWYRVRSMWVFRDKTGLSVTPSLWVTIEAALSHSEYFLIMASPEAAASKWVQREVDWWLSKWGTRNLLVLLTDGEVQWDPANNDWNWGSTTALPLSQFTRHNGRFLLVRLLPRTHEIADETR